MFRTKSKIDINKLKHLPTTEDMFVDEYGAKGTASRDEFDAKSIIFPSVVCFRCVANTTALPSMVALHIIAVVPSALILPRLI